MTSVSIAIFNFLYYLVLNSAGQKGHAQGASSTIKYTALLVYNHGKGLGDPRFGNAWLHIRSNISLFTAHQSLDK